jgi:uncharacterized membrane protein YeaQ/YmgE (transglycosylase-associated protein family)
MAKDIDQKETRCGDMHRTNNKSLTQILRWFAVLPGSIICAILVMFPIHWAVMLIQFSCKEGDTINVEGLMGLLACIPPEMLERFGYALFVPITLIITGAKIAPKYKFQTGIAMAIFWGLLFGCATGMVVAKHTNMGWFRYTITFALGVTGCVLGLLQVYKDQSPKNNQLIDNETVQIGAL